MSIFSKIGKVLKKVAPPVLGIGGALLGAPAIGSALGGLFSGSQASGMGAPNAGPQLPSVNITGQGSGYNWGNLVAPIATGALNYFGQKQTNAANAQMAQKQMDFQEQQTSTSYQRGMADMKSAGLNPILAYSQGGAGSGGGASAQMGNSIGAGANSALDALMTMQQLQAIQADIDNKDASTELLGQQGKQVKAQTVTELARPGLVSAQTTDTKQSAEQREADIRYQMLRSQLLRESMEDQKSSLHSAAQGAKYELAEKGAISRYFGDVGKGGIYWREGTHGARDIGGAVGSVMGAMRRLGK